MSIPQHIAIIMDGNGRWAKAKGLPRTAGHKQGAETTRKILAEAAKQGVKYLTIYAFSFENWRRPEKEVSFLMDLLRLQLKTQIKDLHKNGIKVRIIGDRTRLSKDILEDIEVAEKLTENNSTLSVQVALSYGSRQEILNAVKASGGDEKKFEESLYTKDIPDPDLLIRTGGEHRVSNFLLWQIAYAELYFTPVLWPDFGEEQFLDAIASFVSRERRFGCTGDQIKNWLVSSANNS